MKDGADETTVDVGQGGAGKEYDRKGGPLTADRLCRPPRPSAHSDSEHSIHSATDCPSDEEQIWHDKWHNVLSLKRFNQKRVAWAACWQEKYEKEQEENRMQDAGRMGRERR